MTKIGLISDTHGWLDDQILRELENVDEIWHAGDFGTFEVAQRLQSLKPLRGVFGNIDGSDIRQHFPETLSFSVESVQVHMRHIGGYPGRYAHGVANILRQEKAGMFICGHSHILKVQLDEKLHCLHLNPGAAGHQGWHQIRTLLRFSLNQGKPQQLEVVELGKRGKIG